MLGYQWRKSSYSADASNCIYVATTGDGTCLLRESDDPGVVLALAPGCLGALLRQIRLGSVGAR
ncbi:hypothetical protein GCM10010218_29030 [Streptomyces mashuensis]|uniref:DUF397 domain-containing protein n=1 Tax=Streptomyces mashuensis TaxID=33904 RepID=A0A919ED61_9ACTN|nr:hypothetical protein GCM10010218_29030 [Streptomyces mashuensis]